MIFDGENVGVYSVEYAQTFLVVACGSSPGRWLVDVSGDL